MNHLFLTTDLFSEGPLAEALIALLPRIERRARITAVAAGAEPAAVSTGVRSIAGMDALRKEIAARLEEGVRPYDMLFLTGSESRTEQLDASFGACSPLTVTVGRDDASRVTGLAHLFDLDPRFGLGRLLQAHTAGHYYGAIAGRFEGALQRLFGTGKACIFGAQRLGQDLKGMLGRIGIDVTGYLDNDPGKWGKEFAGRRVRSPRDLEDRDAVIIIGTTRYLDEISRQLDSMHFSSAIPYPVLSIVRPDIFPPEIPYVNVIEDLVEQTREYVGTYIGLADPLSRDVLNGLIEYRLTLEHSAIRAIYDPKAIQYFEPGLLDLSAHERFVDGGGYDGQTTLEFIRFAGEAYDRIYYFEPDPALMQRSQALLADRPNIEFHTCGLYSRSGDIGFQQTGNTAGAIREGGNLTIRVCSLDERIDGPLTFIKMDVEGAEYEALLGARGHILRDRPRLAICAYHCNNDLWRLQKLLHAWVPSYRFHLRHYSQTGLETVLFAIPDRPCGGPAPDPPVTE